MFLKESFSQKSTLFRNYCTSSTMQRNKTTASSLLGMARRYLGDTLNSIIMSKFYWILALSWFGSYPFWVILNNLGVSVQKLRAFWIFNIIPIYFPFSWNNSIIDEMVQYLIYSVFTFTSYYMFSVIQLWPGVLYTLFLFINPWRAAASSHRLTEVYMLLSST